MIINYIHYKIKGPFVYSSSRQLKPAADYSYTPSNLKQWRVDVIPDVCGFHASLLGLQAAGCRPLYLQDHTGSLDLTGSHRISLDAGAADRRVVTAAAELEQPVSHTCPVGHGFLLHAQAAAGPKKINK